MTLRKRLCCVIPSSLTNGCTVGLSFSRRQHIWEKDGTRTRNHLNHNQELYHSATISIFTFFNDVEKVNSISYTMRTDKCALLRGILCFTIHSRAWLLYRLLVSNQSKLPYESISFTMNSRQVNVGLGCTLFNQLSHPSLLKSCQYLIPHLFDKNPLTYLCTLDFKVSYHLGPERTILLLHSLDAL